MCRRDCCRAQRYEGNWCKACACTASMCTIVGLTSVSSFNVLSWQDKEQHHDNAVLQLQLRNQRLEQQLEDLSSFLAAETERADTAEAALADSHAWAAKLSGQLAASEAARQAAEAQVSDCKQQLTHLRQTSGNVAMQQELERLEVELQEYRVKVEALEEELAASQLQQRSNSVDVGSEAQQQQLAMQVLLVQLQDENAQLRNQVRRFTAA